MSDIRLTPPGLAPLAPNPSATPMGGVNGAKPGEFRNALSQLTSAATALGSPSGPSPLRFSNHAVDRMRSRGITYSPEQVSQIQGAIDKVAQKGGRNALLLMDSSAMIVNTDSRTVVTVMDKNNLKENVFTNIDSTMVI